MAIKGIGLEYDLTLKPQGRLLTNTSQYLVVGMSPTSTNADFSAYLTNAGSATADTITARNAIGINQTEQLSASSQDCAVRLLGVSKAKCAASIPAGAVVQAYEGASTTTFAGHIVTATEHTATGTAAVNGVILGRALEKGSTNTVISVFLNPHRHDVVS